MQAIFATTGLSSLQGLVEVLYVLTGIAIVAGIAGGLLLYRKYRKRWLWLLAPVIGLLSAALVTVIFFGGIHLLQR